MKIALNIGLRGREGAREELVYILARVVLITGQEKYEPL